MEDDPYAINGFTKFKQEPLQLQESSSVNGRVLREEQVEVAKVPSSACANGKHARMHDQSDLIVLESSTDSYSQPTSSLNTEKVRRDNLAGNLPQHNFQGHPLEQFHSALSSEQASLTFGGGHRHGQPGSSLESANVLVSA